MFSMRGLDFLLGLVGIVTSVSLAAQTSAAPPAAPTSKTASSINSPPLWKNLTASEQGALSPLMKDWGTMGAGQKRKWQKVAKNFNNLPAEQQAKLQARMLEWAVLSPQQRAAARIHFAEHRELTDGLTPEQRKVQWQAYQQLSQEEKKKLVDSAPKAVAKGAAPAARPQSVLKKDPPPEFGTAKVLAKAKLQLNTPAAGKKIAVAPHVAEHGSILRGEHAEPAQKP